MAEAIPASAASAGGSYAPPTYSGDGTYARPPPISPYASAIAEPSSSSSSSYQHQQHPPGIPAPVPPDRPPLPLEPYPGAGAAYGQQRYQHQHQHQHQRPHQHQPQPLPGAVMGQAVQPMVQGQGPGQGGQPMTGEQVRE